MERYYSRRAQEYEQIYLRDDLIRQGEQTAIAAEMRKIFQNRRVLETACGTGFWTEKIVDVAEHLVATDLSQEMLAIARSKKILDKIEFHQTDAYQLGSVPGIFDAGLANFWFSHMPKVRIAEFLDEFHKKLSKGAVVFMADNVYIPGIGGELVTRPGSEDTFKLRELSDDSKHEVLKNYHSADQLQNIFAPRTRDLKIHVGQCLWWISYAL
ncbi:class I SAM-dependent methyltransferase [Candidatus Acetothermia bacterium]|nr:class I SAM-dependent methyltransferase [Candidatus Acetothermia bacterium]